MLIVGAILLVLLGLLLYASNSLKKPTGRESTASAAAVPAGVAPPKDKTVLVVGPPFGEVLQAATEFTKLYAGTSMNLLAVESGITAAVFPANIDQGRFYYLVNFLLYPLDVSYSQSVRVRGWASLPVVAPCQPGSDPEPVMVFVPETDNEYDFVLLAAAAGPVYRVDFGTMRPIELPQPVAETYLPLPYSPDRLRELGAQAVSVP
ncbi:hypothetical protein GCM10023186_18820 [Hymenobacter koreensis]|uniref:Uncharacterized protein n=2 Tax=Hymenobacter koreensis TaxID=1084523 RepID=A0ABP8IYZ2_9BACT